MKVCKQCMICGDLVELTPTEELSLQHGRTIGEKMCDKCKEAVLYARKQMEAAEK